MHCIGTEEILNRIDDGVILTAPDKTVVFANSAFLRLFQATEEQIVGAKCHEVCHQCPVCISHGGFPPPSACPLDEAFQSGLPKNLRYLHLLPDGETRLFHIAAYPLFDDHGVPIRLLQLFKDITQEEKLREAAEQSHRELQQIFDNAPFNISYLDREMRVVRLNPAMESFIGMKLEDLVGRHCYESWGQYARDESRRGREKICDACKMGQSLAEERNKVYTKKHGAKVVEVTATPVRDRQGEIVGTMEIGRDVTERCQAEEALAVSQRRYYTLFENSPTIIVLADFSGVKGYLDTLRQEGRQDLAAFFAADPEALRACLARLRIIEVNRIAMQLFDAASRQEIAAGLSTIIGPDTAPQTIGGLVAIANGETAFEHEITIHRLAGGTIHAILRWNVVPGHEADYSQAIISLNDIGARKKAEERLTASAARLRRLSSRLAEAEETQNRRLATELHDKLGQRLTALGINLHILGMALTPEQEEICGQRIADSLWLIEEMTEQVRDIMAELRPPMLDDYGLAAALPWYGRLFAERNGIVCEVRAAEVPRLPTKVEMALFRVIQEALTNVAKHSGADQVVVEGGVRDQRLLLSVRDNGRGFPRPAGPDGLEGPGLGMVSMGERVEAIGGTLAVSSAAGHGTTITIEVRV